MATKTTFSAEQEKGSVRMGSITVITLVIVLCLAVLSVLIATTARASSAEAERQQEAISQTYSLEFAAQEYLASVDAALATCGGSANAMAAVQAASPSVAQIDGNDVSVAFVTDDGRRLTVGLTINSDLTYTVTQWVISTDWSEELEEPNLWTGM